MPKKRKKKKNSSLKVLRKTSTKLIRQEYMDYDYIDKLDSETKQWLANFTDEFYNASVGKQDDKGKNNHFHRSKKLVKERQDANNKNNADIYSKSRSKNKLVSLDNLGLQNDDPDFAGHRNINKDNFEDAFIDLIDLKRKNSDDSGSDSDQ